MSHELRSHSTIAVKLFLEGKDHQRLINVFAKQTHAPLPPSPKLRANVIDDWNATFFHLPRNPPVERRRVNDDGQIRLALVGFSDQLVKETPDFRQMTQNFGDTDDREVLRINDSIASGCAHLLTADTEKL